MPPVPSQEKGPRRFVGEAGPAGQVEGQLFVLAFRRQPEYHLPIGHQRWFDVVLLRQPLVLQTQTLGNVGGIESGGGFKFYAEGVTPAIINLYEAIDVERLAIAAELGVTVPNMPEWIERTSGVRESSLITTFQRLTFDPTAQTMPAASDPAM